MPTVSELLVKIEADNKQLKTALNQVTKQVNRFGGDMEKQAKRSASAFSAVSKIFAGGIILQAGRKIIQGVTTLTDAFDKQEKAVASVRNGIQSTGGVAGRTLEQLTAQASELQSKTIFGDEEILQGATAQLLTFTNIAGEQFDRTQQAALDLATKLGGDLQGASIQLGKALNDPVANLSALSRSGIQFSASQKEVIKSLAQSGKLAEAQTIILDELETQYGGTAEAAAKAGTGGFTQVANAFGDVQERIGGLIASTGSGLVPALKEAISFVNEMLNNLGPLKEAFGELKSAFTEQAEALQSVFEELGLVTDKTSAAKGAVEVFATIVKAVTFQFRMWAKFSAAAANGLAWLIGKIKDFRKSSSVFKGITDFIIKPFKDLGDVLSNLPAKLSGFGAAFATFSKRLATLNFKGIGDATAKAYADAYEKGMQKEAPKMADKTEAALTPPIEEVGKSLGKKTARKFNEEIEQIGTKGGDSFKMALAKMVDKVEGVKSVVKLDVQFDTSGTVENRVAEMSASINQALSQAAKDIAQVGLETVGTAIGEAFTGGDLMEVGKAFVSQVGEIVSNIGKQMISLGIAAVLAKESLKSLFANPALAIAAGVGLVAVGAAMKNLLDQGVPGFANGVKGFGGGLAMVGERGPELVNLPGGSDVFPHHKTMAMMSGGGGKVQFEIMNDRLTGALVREDMRRDLNT